PAMRLWTCTLSQLKSTNTTGWAWAADAGEKKNIVRVNRGTMQAVTHNDEHREDLACRALKSPPPPFRLLVTPWSPCTASLLSASDWDPQRNKNTRESLGCGSRPGRTYAALLAGRSAR